MTKFYKSDDTFWIFNSQQNNVVDRLPVGNYVIKRHPISGEFYFAKYDKEFDPPAKLYGDVTKRATRILDTFLSRPASTGVLLSGEKGSGKTMLAKLTSKIAGESHEIPTIFITEPHTSQQFMEFIGSISQPVAVIFDEFEKVYDGEQSDQFGKHDQAAILTLLDGLFSTKTLFILTCNDKNKIDDHFINRPGRLFYSYEFTGLEEDFVREYCLDNLEAVETPMEDRVDDVLRVTSLFRHFNFDMLQAIVEEMNRYGETARECLYHLNINPATDYANYTVTLFPTGSTKPLSFINPARTGNPMTWRSGPMEFYTYELSQAYAKSRDGAKVENPTLTVPHEENDGYVSFHFTVKDVKRTTTTGFELVNSHGERLVLSKESSAAFDWRAL